MAKSAVAVSAEEEYQKTTLSLPKPLHKQLQHAAVDEERDQQEILADALTLYFDSRKKSTRRK